MTRPAVRDDLVALEGYHSPQLDVDVRLNTNESPLPPPPEFVAELREAVGDIRWNRYPDRAATALRKGLAERHGVDPGQVFVANGSNEVLQTVLLTFAGAGRRVLTFEPTYAMHSQIARTSGATVVSRDRLADFSLDASGVLSAMEVADPAVTFLCSPNNPTGMAEPADLIAEVLDHGRGLLVVDEAYGEFAERSAVDLLGEEVPLVVTRTYSKVWSMAAMRLGYMIGPRWLVAELDKVVLPYHLDALKQRAGMLALGHAADMESRVAELVESRRSLVSALSGLDVEVWPSQANFVLFRPRRLPGRDVWQGLVDRSVLVRDCSSWPRLENCLRVTVGSRPENERFLSSLEEVLAP
ncbi:MAG TPA: histidinol-phosphate transaminase [Acidimicrobiales bacterium]|nr:histidinol-phosphate transaminase [Acidimicrobiales bacterium]